MGNNNCCPQCSQPAAASHRPTSWPRCYTSGATVAENHTRNITLDIPCDSVGHLDQIVSRVDRLRVGNRIELMAISCGPVSGDPKSEPAGSSQDMQDGLLPVVKFLQSALAMKARVSDFFGTKWLCWQVWCVAGVCFASYFSSLVLGHVESDAVRICHWCFGCGTAADIWLRAVDNSQYEQNDTARSPGYASGHASRCRLCYAPRERF